MIEVDARGYSCPIPVVKTRQAMDGNPGTELSVLVDEVVAKDNVSRLAKSNGYSVEAEKTGDDYKLTLTPQK
ncbi:sulfurtransferase TusA family protein [Chloroflexota bacterium]